MVIALSVLAVVLFFASYGYKSMYQKTAAELDVVKQENDVIWECLNSQIAELQKELTQALEGK